MDMYESIVERLKGLGYDVKDGYDREDILREMENAKEYLFSQCGINFLPRVLEGTYIDIVCGYFLRDRLYGGKLEDAESGVVESITEGDVSIKYSSGSGLGSRERVEGLIKGLLDKNYQIIANRRLKW